MMCLTKISTTTFVAFTILLATTFIATHAVRPDPEDPNQGNGLGMPEFKLPELGNGGLGSGSMVGGGFGFGFGGPNGGFAKGGVLGSTMVCQEQGPCYMQKLTCPPQCFKSFSNSGDGFGYGGGGGGCNFDCQTTCTATC